MTISQANIWILVKKAAKNRPLRPICSRRFLSPTGSYGDKTQPMGIAEYKLLESLPAELQTSLPSIEQIERELGGDDSVRSQ